ncbi:MAG TPA: Uma2 family endonuclease [Pyrinomonadaceae bacterium]|nr:Uma2 family endonuclease [Pyrinomonadaceae bacterium]
MSTQIKPRYTLEEYFELEKNSDERYEYYNGEVFCMSGVSPNHAQIESNLNLALRLALRERGCRVFPANMRIKVPAAPPYRYPDIVVVCDKPVYEKIGGIDTLTNPALIIEVLSGSTEAYDRGDKFTYYKSIPSFREYLLIAQHRPHVAQFVKQTGDSWTQTEVNELAGSLHLPSVGCTLALGEVYRDVEFSGDVPLEA